MRNQYQVLIFLLMKRNISNKSYSNRSYLYVRLVLILTAFHLIFHNNANAQPSRTIAQLGNPSIKEWPRLPSPWADFDWKQRFLDFDSFIFNWNKTSTFPTIKLDTTHYNMGSNTVYIPAYYGDERIKNDGWQDGLTFIAVVAGSALCGRNKPGQVSSELS
jgi:hypothetical protein